ncbi:2-phosphosulfolactate phosphatase [Truepera radiovictrix]|uniref:Probable 2-phosphosulfolactate phosphatase n=1 Tax=Truepera radiovictrix (strain DSM 17093 / CIP 108686 / LMG 22925 / RQ-24) TaxID=649638 RepID=D7CWZ3_TRURR|nr:2-phosphosulfolactate phosphatase [Truepera radiovictrix]ADI14501.1 2-phosphosulfolactate phosphatase [Truepera radiovictrix DSM 17093]WMT56946.1 2-phosphosulfolactate phosphatase [Truepera radiovictrix]
MKLRVDLLPKSSYGDVVVVIDVLRTCTIAPLLFDRGLEALYMSASIRRALHLAEAKDLLLVGERRGLPPEGFNYGNSPQELLTAPVAGRSAVLVSENAPRVLEQVAGARHLLLGSLYNAEAVAAHAASLAHDEVALVCSGFAGNEDLDDALCAGFLAAQLKRRFGDAELVGATLMSISLFKAFPNPTQALWRSRAGQYLRTLALEDDLATAGLLSASRTVPYLETTFHAEGAPLFRFTAHRVPVPGDQPDRHDVSAAGVGDACAR